MTDAAVRRHQRLALVLLFGVSLFNYMDRYMLAVLLPAIKADLQLSDTQIGLLTGLAFTLFYATLGIPVARLADRSSRRRIIAVAVAFWSAMTALCGLAQNFLQLVVARVLVGAGEAGASPPSHALIADLFPLEQRARALSVYTLGAPLGILFGFALGGWLGGTQGWRVALVAVALPGLALAVLVGRWLPEPERRRVAAPGMAPAENLVTTMALLLRNRSFRQVSLATGLYTVLWLGVVQWLPSFFTRSFGLAMTEVGTVLALVLSASQLAGMLAGGALADRLGRRDLRWYAWLPGLAVGLSTPVFLVSFTTASPMVAYVSLALPFGIGIMQGPATYAVAQGVAPARMRATAAALLLLVTNLIGGGIGPQAVGLLSDFLTPQYGVDALREALKWVALVFGLWAAVHYFLAARSLREDFRAAG